MKNGQPRWLPVRSTADCVNVVLGGANHRFGANDSIELRVGDVTAADGFFAQRRAVLVRGLGDLGGIIIADLRRQRRYQHQRAVERRLDVVFPCLDSDNAIIGKGDCGVGQELYRLQEVVGHQRIVDVELEMALAAGKGERCVVAEHLDADLRQGFALGRVDLTRHDRRARLVFRQRQFAKARTRTGAEEADVVGDLEERCGCGVDGTMAEDHGIVGSQRLKLVGCGDEGDTGDLGDLFGDLFGKADRGVKAGSDRGAALGKFAEAWQGHFDALDRRGDLGGVTGEFLAKRQRCRILGVRAADLDDVIEGLHFGLQCLVQMLQRRQQLVDDLFRAGNVHGRRIGVVGRLAHIDVVVGVNRLLRSHLAAEHFDCPVGDDFVGVHVRLGAGAGLPDDEREMLVEFAVDHFLGGSDDRVADGRIKALQFHVGAGGGLLDDAECAYDRQGLLFPADLEIAERALCLCAPIAVAGDFDRAERICFGAR